MAIERVRAPAIAVVGCLLIAAILLAGCGGSSKPAYCGKVDALKKSVQSLSDIKLVQNGVGSVSAKANTISDDAHAAVSAAKGDFPKETSALTSAADALSTSAKQLTSSPAQTLTSLPGQISAARTAVQNFASATSSKCG